MTNAKTKFWSNPIFIAPAIMVLLGCLCTFAFFYYFIGSTHHRLSHGDITVDLAIPFWSDIYYHPITAEITDAGRVVVPRTFVGGVDNPFTASFAIVKSHQSAAIAVINTDNPNNPIVFYDPTTKVFWAIESGGYNKDADEKRLREQFGLPPKMSHDAGSNTNQE